MNTPETSGQTHKLPPERVLAERWADFTKALAIYPETNTRVKQGLEAMLNALRRALDEGGGDGVSILFRDGHLVYRDVEEEFGSGSNLEWLQTRLVSAALAGVEFHGDAAPAELIEFSKELLAIYLRKLPDPTFETLWPRSFDGLTLIDRRFEGGFGAPTPQAPYRGGHAVAPAPEGGQRKLVDALLADEAIVERLQRLDGETAEPGDETVSAVELLARIVDEMPADTMRNRQTLVQAVCDVLESVRERSRSTGGEDPSPMVDEGTLRTLVHSVSRTFFARQGPDETRWALDEVLPDLDDEPRTRGHAGDELVGDDVDALLTEIDELPTELRVDLSPSQVELPAETLGVLLHYLVNAREPGRLDGLDALVRPLLEDPGADEQAMLRAYLDVEGQMGSGGGEARPILKFLRAARRTDLLRECGVLRPEWVADAYPSFFPLYLESIDPRTHSGLAELDDVCTRVGSDRFLDGIPSLEADGLPLSAQGAAELLTKPQLVRMPLARLLLGVYGRTIAAEVTQFLRKLDLGVPEAFVLYQLGDSKYMTIEYLKGLIDVSLGRMEGERLHLLIADVLCRHIRATAKTDPSGSTRIESIRNLGRFPSANSWFMLSELGRTVWNPFAPREPALIRRLARSIQRNYKAA